MTGLAFLVTGIADGKAGTRDLRFYTFPTRPQWYLVALAFAPALLLVVSLFMHGTAALGPFKSHAIEIVTVYLQNVVTFRNSYQHLGGGRLDGFRDHPAAARCAGIPKSLTDTNLSFTLSRSARSRIRPSQSRTTTSRSETITPARKRKSPYHATTSNAPTTMIVPMAIRLDESSRTIASQSWIPTNARANTNSGQRD